jgi:superfamily II DNA or RNA helicase
MVKLTLDNRFLVVEGLDLATSRLVSKLTSYLQAGYVHSKAYQAHSWDGRRRVIRMTSDGKLRAPAGVAQEIADILANYGVDATLVDRRRLPDYRLGLVFDEGKLRPYQKDALLAATTPRGTLETVGRGILKMAPRSGKTVTAAAIIAKLDVRSLFIVPSKFLLYQAAESLERDLGVKVGRIGDGEWDVQDVTVATAQTLTLRRGDSAQKVPPTPEYRELVRRADLVICDEIHHLSGDSEWRRVLQDSDAPYKIGLSATVFPDHERETELGIIWVRASTGDLLIDVSISDLIELGWLVPTYIYMAPVREPDLRGRRWSMSLYSEAVFRNEIRNKLVVEAVTKLVKQDKRVIVITNKLEQVEAVTRLLSRTSVRYERMIGATDQAARDRLVSRFKSGQLQAIVSTVLDEGVDIPEIDAVVVAEGGKDIKSTYQRLRCMTPCDGKKVAIVVDFFDLTHPYFAAHSLQRLEAYKAERAFKISAKLYN